MESPAYILEFEKPLRELARQLDELRQQSLESNVDVAKEIRLIEKKIERTQREIYSNLTPWEKVLLARHPRRPYALDYIAMICRGFQELHGDRQFNDDRALVGGTAFIDGLPVVLIAQQKGRDPKERLVRNFGMPQPEGYRKALRIMRLAEKFGLPVLSFIDTPGAFPGIGSEERHVSEAIAVNLREMAMLRTPTISVVVGEGGSGGAHNDPAQAAAALKYAIQKHLNDLRALDLEKLLETRYERFRHLGSYEEAGVVRSSAPSRASAETTV